MTITPALDNSVTTLTRKGDVVRGQTCNFLLRFPSTAKTGDVIYFRVNINSRCSVYYTVAPSYSNNIVRSGTAAKSTRLQIVYPE
jgi:hypothetical protein